jgi:hypothetical protein
MEESTKYKEFVSGISLAEKFLFGGNFSKDAFWAQVKKQWEWELRDPETLKELGLKPFNIEDIRVKYPIEVSPATEEFQGGGGIYFKITIEVPQ